MSRTATDTADVPGIAGTGRCRDVAGPGRSRRLGQYPR